MKSTCVLSHLILRNTLWNGRCYDLQYKGEETKLCAYVKHSWVAGAGQAVANGVVWPASAEEESKVGWGQEKKCFPDMEGFVFVS